MRRIAPAVAAIAALLGGACIPSLALRTGRPIGDDQVRAIVPGTTTKAELFERFGAPAGVAARGEIVAIATPATWRAGYGTGSSYSLDADTMYELFPGGGAPDEYRRIYYFHHVVGDKMNYFALLAIYESGSMTWDRLWAVVDERTGTVEEFAFRKSGGPTVFVRPGRAAPR